MTDETKAALAVLIRHGLTLGAGFAVGKGYVDADSAMQIAGAIGALIPVGLALFSRKKVEAKVAAAKDAPRETVLTPEQRADMTGGGG